MVCRTLETFFFKHLQLLKKTCKFASDKRGHQFDTCFYQAYLVKIPKKSPIITTPHDIF